MQNYELFVSHSNTYRPMSSKSRLYLPCPCLKWFCFYAKLLIINSSLMSLGQWIQQVVPVPWQHVLAIPTTQSLASISTSSYCCWKSTMYQNQWPEDSPCLFSAANATTDWVDYKERCLFGPIVPGQGQEAKSWLAESKSRARITQQETIHLAKLVPVLLQNHTSDDL